MTFPAKAIALRGAQENAISWPLGLLLFLMLSLVNAVAAEPERPNILFCLGDDFGWPVAGAYGDKVVRTPNFDRVAREGVLFNHGYCAAPSCTPSRASMLTGQMFYRLEEGGILWSFLPNKYPVYTDMLEKSGYQVGITRKGWGPGDYKIGGWTRNPAGTTYKTFDEFLVSVPKGKPFCFWFGAHDPHRPYAPGSGVASGLKISDVKVPPWLPDVPETRNDILDYYVEVERFDREVGELMAVLEKRGQLDNTLVLISGDNGWPFPRAKAYLYDRGIHQPLAVRWPARAKGGRVVDDFVSLSDLAPTFLEAAGLMPTPEMTGRSFLNILTSGKSGQVDPTRDRVVAGLEKHGQLFPMRTLKTHQFQYIRNFMPGPYLCTDSGPTIEFLKAHAEAPEYKQMAQWCFGERPAEELYDLVKDPYELNNVANLPAYAEVKKRMAADLEEYLRKTNDPRITGKGIEKLENAPRSNTKDKGGQGGKKKKKG